MAKQEGIHGLRGKIGGMSYYAMKGVDGGLVRKVNEGMSTRVKNDDAFLNTRLNASEFGAAGNFSGAVVRTVSKRWRFILQSFATAATTKFVNGEIKQDTTNDWGQRTLNVTGWQSRVRQFLTQIVKNPYVENFSTGFAASADAAGSAIGITVNILATDSIGLLNRGAEGVKYEFYLQTVDAPVFSSASGKYPSVATTLEKIGEVEHQIGTAKSTPLTSTVKAIEEASGKMVNVLVVALPFKAINSQNYTLQELCSANWLTLTIEE